MHSIVKFEISFLHNASKEEGTIVFTPFHAIVTPSEGSVCISLKPDRGILAVVHKDAASYPEIVEYDPKGSDTNDVADVKLRNRIREVVQEVFHAELESRKVDVRTINRVCDILYGNPLFALS